MKKNKETGISINDFFIFAWVIHLQARGSGYRNTWVEVEKTKLARNTIFEGN